MDTQPNQLKRVADRLSMKVTEEVEAITVNTLILGPAIDGKRLKPPARLRRALLERCPRYGAAVLGEHRSIEAAYRRAVKARYNLCTYEFELALTCDLIIILPASPGSYAELGLFALEEDIARKSVILFDQDFKKEKSFLRYGPRKVYKDFKAVIFDVDYRDIDGVWKKVEAEIQSARERIRFRRFRSGPKQDE